MVTLLGTPGTTDGGEIRDANCNAVFVEVRRDADVCYPSGVGEPYFRSGLTPSNFDALTAIINAAHDTTGGKKRIEVHCWMVAFATGGGAVYLAHMTPRPAASPISTTTGSRATTPAPRPRTTHSTPATHCA